MLADVVRRVHLLYAQLTEAFFSPSLCQAHGKKGKRGWGRNGPGKEEMGVKALSSSSPFSLFSFEVMRKGMGGCG